MEGYIGQILLFAGIFAPKGWMYCNGGLLPINQNQALFSILGTTYGGDGKTTFALPNLAPVNNTGVQAAIKYVICIQGIYPSRP